MKKIIGISVTLVLASMWAIFFRTSEAALPKLGLDVKVSTISDLNISQVTLDVHSNNLQIKGTYPQIADSKEKLAKEFNKLIKDKIDKEIAKFKKDVKENEQYSQDMPPELRINTYIFSYDLSLLQFNQQKIISLLFKAESMLAGSAHPSHPYWSLNYDLNSCKKLTLASIFKQDPEYLSKLSNASQTILTRRFKKNDYKFDVNWLNEGTAPKTDNFNIWNVTEKGVTITFPEYQVAPYSVGVQTVVIPYM